MRHAVDLGVVSKIGASAQGATEVRGGIGHHFLPNSWSKLLCDLLRGRGMRPIVRRLWAWMPVCAALSAVRSGEVMVEMIYQAQIAPWWMLQPEIQYIVRPGAGVLNSDGTLRQNAWVIALRSALNF
jgi:hypothetical protein